MLFSQRNKLKSIKNLIQFQEMDQDLRNALWDALTTHYFKNNTPNYISQDRELFQLIKLLWNEYFKKPIDSINHNWHTTYNEIRKYYFSCQWYEVYDFIEFIAGAYPLLNINTRFMKFSNIFLERELSAYRFVGGLITQITSEVEIEEIEKAISNTDPLTTINTHLRTSLERLSDRKNPDYRNAIKESISAVESLCTLISGNQKAGLSDALKVLEKNIKIHRALRKAFDSIYGYTSDADGIRHALLDESDLDFEDAKFMLVSCSAFVNYLISKSNKEGVKIQPK